MIDISVQDFTSPSLRVRRILSCRDFRETRSVVSVRETSTASRAAAAATGDGDKAIDAEGDGGEDGEEEDDDDGDNVVFLHLGGLGLSGLRAGAEGWIGGSAAVRARMRSEVIQKLELRAFTRCLE